ncbi:PRKR-interacting protein 1 homolog [Lycorma delicatula]|uniref:PRKR-interacting protein 1 homolog n=1 Tax=Lycorma delicatula TaxID=130591 RepID=UPI003F511405
MVNEDDSDDAKPTVARNATELQRMKLEKLMKNPEKSVVIPERQKEKKSPHVPEFVRNVMGSSAGAGSGEFHVYRHLRRKEYARQKFIQEKAEKEVLEEAYHHKILENRQACDERTAKKRAKRLKKKQKKKKLKTDYNKSKNSGSDKDSSELSSSDSDCDKQKS